MINNKYLAETVILFGKRLREVKDDDDETAWLIDGLYRHYVVNTKGPIPTYETDVTAADTEDALDVFEEATVYAKIINAGGSRATDGTSLLNINGKQIPCPSWGVLPGWSPAYSLRQVGPVINKVRYGRDDVIPSSLIGFAEDAAGFTLENALVLADFSQRAYLNSVFVESRLAGWGCGSFTRIEDEKSDSQSLVETKDGHAIVRFRGTGSGRDRITDLKLRKAGSTDGNGRVHRGFEGALDGVWGGIVSELEKLENNVRVFFIGHSPSATLAQLAAYRRATSHPDQVAGVYVYGSPRVGIGDIKRAYNDLLKGISYLFINNTDIAPKVPPRLLGYRHVGNLPNHFDEGHRLSTPEEEGSFEDFAEVERIEELPPELQVTVRRELEDAQHMVAATTEFLETGPEDLEPVSYATNFEAGLVDDHGMEQYPFKFGCAIVDGKFQRIREEFTTRS